MIKGYSTAENIINESLSEIRDFNRRYYKEASVYFMKGYRDFQLFESVGQVSESWESITSINTVNYPEDLLRIVDVGVLVNGEFFSFTKSNKLRIPSDPLEETINEERGEDVNVNRSPSEGYSAKGSNLEYYYKEDNKNRRLVLNRLAIDQTTFADRDEVLIRYISTGITDYRNTFVASDAANLLSAYVVYKLVESRPDKYNLGYISMKKENYYEARNMYHALGLPSLQELEDMIYETSGQIIRRV